MVDANQVAVEVGQIDEDTLVGDAPVKWEAHGTLVRVLLAADAAVTMVSTVVIAVKVTVNAIIAAGDNDTEPEFETLLVSLGQQQPMRMATGTTSIKLQVRAASHSFVSLLDEVLEAGAVRNGHIGLFAGAVNHMVSSFD